ncbi:MAG: hypothetical protein IKA50_02850 [Clostridia bacterium]|nr:hypothetical protein [Clostridia bacterium]
MDICVAGMPMRIDSAQQEWFDSLYQPYERQDDRASMMNIRTRMLDEIPCPEGEEVQSIKSATILKLADGRHCRYSRNLDGHIYLATFYNDDYSDVEIQMRKGMIHPQFTSEGWEYSLTGFSFQDRLTYLGNGVLHASSLAWRGKGIAFSANSGTGKSTHVGLWQQLLGDEVTVVNDDKPAIVFEDGQAMLCGTPWSGKSAINANVTVPLKAIVFIERGEKNSICRLDPLRSYFYLTSQLARPYYDVNLGEKLVEFGERLLANVPIYCLTCNISTEAVETVIKEIFPEEEI